MKLKHLYILLTALMAFYFVPVNAQVKSKKKATQKKAAPVTEATAKRLGDAASKVAQDTSKKGQTPAKPVESALSEEIVVTTSYKPVLADAVKIRRNPDLEDKTPYKAPLSYSSLDKRLEKDNEIQQLEAMKRPPERDSVPTNNYARAGVGNMKTTFLEGYFGNGRDEALQVGGYVKHFAQSGTAFNKQNESRNEIGVFGKSIMAENTLSGRIDYRRRGTNFYGFNTDVETPPEFDPQKQTFNTISAEGELAKNYTDEENAFTYALKFKGYVFSNAYQARESNVVLTGFLNKTVKQFYAGMAASLDFGTQKDSLYSYNNSLIRLNPYIKLQGEKYKIDAGVNIVKEFGFSSRFFIFPAAKLEFQVVPKYVRLFAEAKGDVNKASIRDFAETNPFIGENITLKNSVDKLAISVGAKGTLAPGLGFKATFFRNTVKDLPMFVNDFGSKMGVNNKFAVIYDEGNARVSGFNGELDFKATDDLNIFGRVEFRDYQLASEEQALNLPKFKLTAGTIIRISNKVNINGSLLFRGDTKDRFLLAGETEHEYVSIPSMVDLNGGVEYKATKQLSIFVQVNNILNNTNATYLYYNNYGFNIFGGVGYAF